MRARDEINEGVVKLRPRPDRADRGRRPGHEVDHESHHEPEPAPPPPRGAPAGARSSEGAEDVILRHAGLVAIAVAVLSYKLATAAHLSARVVNGEAPSYPLSELPEILWRVVHDPFDPGAAWAPVNTGGEVPGPGAYWLTFLVLVVVHLFLVWVPLYSLKRVWLGGRRSGSVIWADEKDIKDQLVNPKEEPAEIDRLVVGRYGKRNLTIDRTDSLLLVGPQHSGKTNGLSVPTLLEWDGPALVVASKGHLMDQTIGWRQQRGQVRVFDPASESRHERSGWVFLDECGDWEGAITMAQHLTAATYGSVGGRIDDGSPDRIDQGALWGGSMAMALAPFLYAAAITGGSVMQAAAWIIREEREEVLDILYPVDKDAARTHETTFHRRDPSVTAFFHHVYDMLSVYGDPGVAASATKRDIVPENLLGGRHETLYLFAPEHDQARFQPLFTTIVRQTLTAVNDRYAASGRPLRSPLLVLLDGTVSAASIQAVSQMASTGREKGVEMVTVFDEGDWTDEMQAEATATLLENHRALLVMAGSWRNDGETASIIGWPEVTEVLEPGEAALFYGNRRPVRVELRRWTDDERLRPRVAEPERAARGIVSRGPSHVPPADAPEYTLIDQTAAWRRRGRPSREDPIDVSVPSDHGLSRKRVQNVFTRGYAHDADEEPQAEVPVERRRRYRP